MNTHPDVALIEDVMNRMFFLGGREDETLFLLLDAAEQRAWEDVERLHEIQTCVVPSDWSNPDPARVRLSTQSRQLFAMLLDRLAAYPPSDHVWPRRPTEAALMIARAVPAFRQFIQIQGGN